MSPRARLLALFAIAVVPLILGVWVPRAVEIGLILNLLVAAAAVLDMVITPTTRQIVVERAVGEVLSVGAENPVVLRATNQSRHSLVVELTDETPQPGQTTELPVKLQLAPWKDHVATYHFQPQRRAQRAGQPSPAHRHRCLSRRRRRGIDHRPGPPHRHASRVGSVRA